MCKVIRLESTNQPRGLLSHELSTQKINQDYLHNR